MSVLISPKINPSIPFFPLSSTQIKEERLLVSLREKAENYLKAINEVLFQYTELVRTKKYVHNSEDTSIAVLSLTDAPTSFRDLRIVLFRLENEKLPESLYMVGQ